MMQFLLIKFVLAGIVFFAVLNLAGAHTWVERKQSALIQDRIGANRADIFGFRLLGIFHGLADVLNRRRPRRRLVAFHFTSWLNGAMDGDKLT